jgi:hypothetical protein
VELNALLATIEAGDQEKGMVAFLVETEEERPISFLFSNRTTFHSQ